MKREIALSMVAMMCACCLGLAACGGSSGSSSTAASSSSASASTSESASAPASSEAASSAPESSASGSSAAQDSRVKAYWGTIDSKGGVHMAYGETNESMGSEATVDAQAKGSSYYSKETMTVKGYTNTKITAMIDGVAMNLDVDAKTGRVATTTTSQVAKNPMLMDDVYKALWTCAKLSPSSTEKGEMDGVAYTVETYKQQYTADDMFYFDDEGNLAYYVQGSMKSGNTEIGETVYKINAIDAAVDESLFDVSGYAIEGR